MVIVVGCVSPETAEERTNYLNGLNLRLSANTFSPIPPLVILDDLAIIGSGRTPNWVTYRLPNLRAQRFYTVKPLQLDLILESQKLDPTHQRAFLDAAIASDPTRPQASSELNMPSMDSILDYVNIASVVDQLMHGKITTSSLIGSEVTQPKHEPTVQDSSVQSTLKAALLAPLKLLGIACNAPFPVLYSGSTLAKDMSATLQQIDVRLEQTLNAGEQYRATKPRNVRDIAWSTARYINFFNCVWLIANDIIIGAALGGFICENNVILARLGSQFTHYYFIELLRQSLHWLDNWPIGLKLNTELSGFLCASFSAGIDYWEYILKMATPYFPLALYCIGSAGSLGITMILSLISDGLGILTLHIYVCYLLATTVFARLLKLIGSLFNLFRGKRRNILRNRTDTWNYDMDQLMLGTILFTLVTFLFPTVAVYYMLFTLVRYSTWGNWNASMFGNDTGFPQSFSTICAHVADEGPSKASWWHRDSP
ncbi:N-acetylglucosaminyl-phosphatidylinositol biosynthetic protein gpi1 [Schizosaccharomyces pombe 972h-] [Rhizoctonia solani]|uniref:N-acetylglucosaminyl-phosphatidylinositol biosynthetic protein gpi1 [Schizosaccharomyces pombe 972h-] n=1 Tax=Rhizoctonia solani TaxID=456999 RepID=A0A0K6G8W4_9AGAM|nr:N-acetylglucosaminyl-phosphatidylinositol biosynthetic protein gpi1 [Schizosaccharomyces pombe 972h-] [Rhizoctonia solani]